jgi:Cu(I)/Ag(I) efflux system membrane fusion protein
MKPSTDPELKLLDHEEGVPRGVRTMSIVRWVLVALAGLVAVLSVVGYVRLHVGGGEESAAGIRYTCPMHPSVVQDHPGECPICSMTLVPKPAGKLKPSATMNPVVEGMPADPATSVKGLAPVDLTPDRIQLIGMRTAPVKREGQGGELRTVGVVAPSEGGLAQITTRFEGWVEKLLVSETGQRVRRGQVLATIYSPELLRAQQELLVARGWANEEKSGREGVNLNLDVSARQRLELLGISAQEIDEVLRTGKALQAVAVRSPVDGYVISKNAVTGLTVQPGTVLFEVVDLAKVWVTADIYELDIARVHVGQVASFEPSSYSGETHVGKVQFVYPVMDAQSRTLRVRLEFKNRFDKGEPRLRPGMYGTVRLALPATSGLMVPAEAVVDTGEAHYVFVAKAGGHFEPRAVKIGARAKDKVEIQSGLVEGETVVTTGNFLLDSESRLRAAIEGVAVEPAEKSETMSPPGR